MTPTDRTPVDSLTIRALAVVALATVLGPLLPEGISAMDTAAQLLGVAVAVWGRWRVGDLVLPRWLGGAGGA